MSFVPPPATPAGTVMIVDDEPDNLNVLEATLSHAGYCTSLFPRGELALAAAYETRPDLLLLDVRMPGMDGHEVCRRFKADERLRQIPIIFISALTAMDDVAAGFACGGVDYITKPFREPEVLARVRTHVALRRAYVKQAEQYMCLKVLERHRDTLVHMLVHDLRSPLQVILGHLEMIEAASDQRLSPEDLDGLRAGIYNTRLLSRMVSTAIDLSRMETVGVPLRRQDVTAAELFLNARAQSLDPASRRPVAEQIADTCPHLWCDRELTSRVVANLLANALKYSPRDSAIVLGAAPDPGGVRLWVGDRGQGIPAKYHKRIFEKFGVLDQSSDQRITSTGLGLTFCRLAVEAQGGTIGVESTPGQGSTFWFTLPVALPA